MRIFLDLTKSGIICFVLLCSLAGFAMSAPAFVPWDLTRLTVVFLALYFLSAGSFALNQAQESEIDARMPRTTNRPIPSGKVSVREAVTIGIGFLLIGVVLSFFVSQLVGILGLLTVFLYNGMYTLYWKKRWAFGAVPGAIPGAMPVVIGFAANTNDIFRTEIIYAFLMMFLWQMPHFWALAIKFKDDYQSGGIPVLPTRIGTPATLYHMGLYMFAYIALAVASPLFTNAHYLYVLIVLPLSAKVMIEFVKFYRAEARAKFLSFFLWMNFSVLIYLMVPVLDKWVRYHQMVSGS